MDREGFRNRLKQYKQAREENPGLKYWEWRNAVSTEENPIYYDELTDLERQLNVVNPLIEEYEQIEKDLIERRNKLSEDYKVPYLKDKEIILSNAGSMTGARLTTNLLDSIAKYSDKTELSLQEAIGLAAQETTFGQKVRLFNKIHNNSNADDYVVDKILSDWRYRNGNVNDYLDKKFYQRSKKAQQLEQAAYDQAMSWEGRPTDEQLQEQITLNKRASLQIANDQVDFLINHYNDFKNAWSDYEEKTIPPFEHAFEYYKTGKYNPGDPTHTDMVKLKGKEVMQSPEFKKWAEENNIKYAEGGEVQSNDFMKQFGKQVSYKPEETSWWSNVKNWWNDLTGMKNYAYGNCATTPNGKHTKECAHYSNSVLRNQGYKNIVGDAWTRAANSGMKKITSGYDGLTKPAEWNESDAHDYLQSAANNFINNVDTTALNPYDVIGLYYPDSPNTKKAFEQGRWGETQTHTGHIAVGNDGTHYVVHNVGGHLKMNKLADMLTGDYDYLPVSAYRPKK